jgi:uncharacterized protein DUF3568
MRSVGMVVSVLALSVGAGVAGCKSTNGGTGTYNAVTRDLSSTVEAPLDRTFQATRDAVRDMGFRETKANKDATTGVVQAKDAGDHTIEVRLRRASDRVTELTIDQGMLTGQEDKGRMLLDKIKSRL